MAQRRDYPIKFTPRGLTDAWDATEVFPGACRSLQNLIFDQSNPEQVICRPGVGAPVTSFSTFNAPTFISVHICLNNIIFGMVSSSRNPGYDEPFAYNLTTGVFETITGVTGGNVPQSLSTSGDWTPPTMAIVGIKIIITHAGFSGIGSNFFGVIDITNPAAPSWSSQNTATYALPSVPTSVTNFNNRAYFACGNLAYFSDPLNPLNMTNAGQALTVGDPSPITAFCGLPVQTTSAGVVAALIVFKAFQIWQITGDLSISGSLSQNYLSLNVGCTSPRSVVQTPVGTIFIGIDGPYQVSPLGQVLPLTKDATRLIQDLQAPFQNVTYPSRASAGFTGSIYRVCLQTTINGTNSVNDYWFDVTVRRWCGPHTFSYDCVSQAGNYFLISYSGYGANFFQSQYIPSLTSTYLDNGQAIPIYLESSMFPKTQNINVKQVVESTIELASETASIEYSISAVDENYSQIGQCTLDVSRNVPLWGGGELWGDGTLWTTSNTPPLTTTIPWPAPLVFKKMAIMISTTASNALAIGTMFAKYQDTGYTNNNLQGTGLA